MKTASLDNRIWRYGAIALFVGVPLVLLFLVVINVRQTVEARAHIEQERVVLSQMVAKLATRPGRTLTATDKASLYLKSATGSLARAEFQTLVTRATEAAGGRLVEVQSNGTPEQETDGTLSMELTMAIDNKGLLDFLYGVEAALPLMKITTLSVQTSSRDSANGFGVRALMSVTVGIQGYFRKGIG